MEPTYSITPADIPRLLARNYVLCTLIKKERKDPRIVHNPAPMTRPKAKPRVPGLSLSLYTSAVSSCKVDGPT